MNSLAKHARHGKLSADRLTELTSFLQHGIQTDQHSDWLKRKCIQALPSVVRGSATANLTQITSTVARIMSDSNQPAFVRAAACRTLAEMTSGIADQRHAVAAVQVIRELSEELNASPGDLIWRWTFLDLYVGTHGSDVEVTTNDNTFSGLLDGFDPKPNLIVSLLHEAILQRDNETPIPAFMLNDIDDWLNQHDAASTK